jgi:hypothetical protein
MSEVIAAEASRCVVSRAAGFTTDVGYGNSRSTFVGDAGNCPAQVRRPSAARR